MLEVAEQVFDLPVRLGQPGGVNGLTEPASGPQFATAVGLALYAARNIGKDPARQFSGHSWTFFRFPTLVRNWLAEMF
jgi:cell division protein FtsA